jgi:hypothetical protein
VHYLMAAFISLIIGIIANIISELILRLIDRGQHHTAALLSAATIAVVAFIILQAVIPSGSSPGNDNSGAPSSSSPIQARTPSENPPASSPSPKPSPKPKPSPEHTQLYRGIAISMPGGSCGGSTVVAFGTSEPAVYTSVETLLNDPSKWDISFSSCATHNDQEELQISQGSSLTTAVSPSSSPTSCQKQITENPTGMQLFPQRNQTMSFETQNNILVRMTFTSIDQGASYELHAIVTAWKM